MRYKLLGQHTGLRLSEIILGAGMFGTRWGHGADIEESRKIFAGYVEAGGNFIDTSDTYQFGESEEFLGEFIKPHREEVFLTTKFTMSADPKSGILATGNSRKAMIQSLEQSLKRFKTDRLDLYWVHFPDAVTPIEEIVRGLEDLVQSGKILYFGFSDFPAWRVSAASVLANLRGWTSVAAQQIEYSLVERTPERDLIPMAAAHGIATVGWSPLGGGLLTGKYRKGETGRDQGMKGRVFQPENSPQRSAIIDTLEVIAAENDSNPGRVAIAWVRAKGVWPIIGPRTRTQLDDNLASLDLVLSPEQLLRLDEVSAISLGFPHDVLSPPPLQNRLAGGKLDLFDRPTVPVR